MYINSALAGGTPPGPADFARAAQGQIDNDVLRELARRPPERVVQELDAKSILIGTCATAEGQAYIVELLRELKPLVLTTARPKSLPDLTEPPPPTESEPAKPVPPTELPKDL